MPDLELYRRHTPECPHHSKHHADKEGYNSRLRTKCDCPIWADGVLDGKECRKSLKTRDWSRAIRKLAALEDPRAPRCKPVTEALAAFERHMGGRAPATRAKYAITIRELREYCKRERLADLSQITLEHLDAFRDGRQLGPIASLRELGRLRYIFKFCAKRKWITENPAADSEAPRNIKPPEVVPYEPAEVTKMLAACETLGRGPYERLRARALVLVLRYTGLRITDAITLERARINNGQLLLFTQKTGGTVFLPIPAVLQGALDSLPAPRGTVGEPRHYFWNGVASRRAIKGVAERTLATVFKLAGVQGAHAHRFRHTLATDILVQGGTEQDVADVLGISPAIVRRHYAKWSRARQARIASLMQAVYPGTYQVQEKTEAVIN